MSLIPRKSCPSFAKDDYRKTREWEMTEWFKTVIRVDIPIEGVVPRVFDFSRSPRFSDTVLRLPYVDRDGDCDCPTNIRPAAATQNGVYGYATKIKTDVF